MASGKKDYFRHSFFARNDLKLRRLRDKIGIGFYFYYFSLLEHCGEESSQELQENYEFHDSIIRGLWGVNLKKSERVANEMMAVGLLFFKKGENTFQFTIPNFAKYLGKYTSKFPSNTVKKRKEKKNKVNKNNADFSSDEKNENGHFDNQNNNALHPDKILKKPLFDIQKIYEAYPKKQGGSVGLKKLKSVIKDQETFDLILNASENYARYIKKNQTEMKYIKLFSTWVNQESWSDELLFDKTILEKKKDFIGNVFIKEELAT